MSVLSDRGLTFHIATLEEELQELVERMLDDSDFAADADIVSRAIERLKEKNGVSFA